VIESDQSADRNARRRFWRAAAMGGLIAAPVFYWIVSAGQLNPLHAEPFGNFYDIQAHSLLELRWDVPTKAVAFEGFLINGKTYLYFGPVPALLRMPVLAFTHSFDGRLTQVSMLAAFAVALVFIGRLSWRIRRLVRGDVPVSRLELWAVGGYTFLIATGSVTLFLGSRAFVYHETELWGAALALAAYDAILGFLTEPSRRWIVLAAVWSSLAFLTRATVGVGPVVALAIVLVAVVLRRLHARRLAAPARWLAVPDAARTNSMIGWLGAAVAVPIVLYAYVNYSRFGTLFGLPLDKQVYSQFNPARQRALAQNGGSLFGLKFLPTQLLQLLRPDALRLDSLFPWVTFPGRATVLGGVTFDTREWASSIPASMPAFTLLALFGVGAIVRRAGAAAVRAPLIGAVAGGLATLTIAFVAHRYISDLMPAIVLASLVGLHVLLSVRARSPGVGWTRITGIALVVLVVMSLWVNFALAIYYQRALDPATDARRAGFIGFQQDVDGWVPGGPHGIVHAGTELPEHGSLGELLVLGDCGGLYWSDSRVWYAIERGSGAGHLRLRVQFPAASTGQEPLLSLGAGAEQNVLSVRYLAGGRARFVLESPVAPRPLVSTPRRLDPNRPYALDVTVDRRIGTVRVTIDDRSVLDAIAFLVSGDQTTIGATGDPANPARFSGSIRDLPVPTPLCDSVRSRATR
jgi:hypothetical protein